MLPVEQDLIRSELVGTKEILEKWISRVEAGLPMLDQPGTEQALDDFIRALCGELLVAAGRCETLSAVLREG